MAGLIRAQNTWSRPVYELILFVMPDLIRHPGIFEKTGFRLSPE
jgi:hypothetical protein